MGCIYASNCPAINTVFTDNGIKKICCTTDLCNDHLSLKSLPNHYEPIINAAASESPKNLSGIAVFLCIFSSIKVFQEKIINF